VRGYGIGCVVLVPEPSAGQIGTDSNFSVTDNTECIGPEWPSANTVLNIQVGLARKTFGKPPKAVQKNKRLRTGLGTSQDVGRRFSTNPH
jgi:hypothetical protein